MKTQSSRMLRLVLAACAAAVLAACGGGGDEAPTPAARVKYSRLISFGDSLSDVGSYATPGVKAAGGGRYTVNAPGARVWVEVLASDWLGVAAPCAAEVGLNSVEAVPTVAPLRSMPAVTNAGCTGYAQGGARVTDPVGPGNRALFDLAGDATGAIGQLTKPVVAQIAAFHAANPAGFKADEVVTVLAGANDLFIQLGRARAGATDMGPQMVTAAAQLANLIKTEIVAKGAKKVVVLNVSDVSATPFGLSQSAQNQAAILGLVTAYNDRLKADLAGTQGVLFVDLFARIKALSSDPTGAARVGLTNLTATACDLTKVPTSLLCNSSTVVAANVSGYAFADSVHPSPRAYALIAGIVAEDMLKAGWL